MYPDIEATYKNFENGVYNSALRPGLTSKSGPDVFDMAPGGLEYTLRKELASQPPDWLDPLECAVAGGAIPLASTGT